MTRFLRLNLTHPPILETDGQVGHQRVGAWDGVVPWDAADLPGREPRAAFVETGRLRVVAKNARGIYENGETNYITLTPASKVGVPGFS